MGEEDLESDLHWEAIERLLFIYAKLNPAIGYVQGMNELIAPVYYVHVPLPHVAFPHLPFYFYEACYGADT